MDILNWPFDSEYILRKHRRIRRELVADGSSRLKKRIAILGGYTTENIKLMAELFLLNHGIEPEFYESEYNKWYEDALFGNDELASFAPDIIYICTSIHNIAAMPSPDMESDEVAALLASELARFEQAWDALFARYACPIIQNNFELLPYRLMGNMDGSDSRGHVRFVRSLNEMFADRVERTDGLYLMDICYLSSYFGLARWQDAQQYYLYKYALAQNAMPLLAHNLANIIKAIFGKNKKAFAMDLDNTLWGGIVGDDGVEGIAVGEETAEAEAYSAFQKYIKAHKNIGVVLTVASKNEEENAMAGLNHPDSRLSPDDFVSIKANWEPKSQNISQLADELTLGTDAFVFVDDNPAEREIVRQHITGIAVPEITPDAHAMVDASKYIDIIDKSGYFEAVAITDADKDKTEQYKRKARAAAEVQAFENYGDYLLSLNMEAEVHGFLPTDIPRVTQLANKSNQFNLTTKRYTEAEVKAVGEDPSRICLCGRLRDKFGDNGIVSVAIGRIEQNGAESSLHLELWLMSCRVLKRDMEFAMMDEMARLAATRGIDEIHGYYCPTAKNKMVKDFYGLHGFEKISEDEGGNAVWHIKLREYIEKNKVIRVVNG